MKDESLTLEAEIVEKRTIPGRVGDAFARGNRLQAVSTVGAADSNAGTRGAVFVEFLKPTFSNLFFLGCLLGLFILYCCSCVIHALTYPVRKKSS